MFSRAQSGRLMASAAGIALAVAGGGTAVAQTSAAQSPVGVAAQPVMAQNGVVAGRVYSERTGEYMRAAIVELLYADGETRSVSTDEGGYFTLRDLPHGPANLRVRFTGYAIDTQAITVSAQAQQGLEIALRQPDANESAQGEIIVLGAREGDAREIMVQRESMNIKEVLSAESYGDIADTNPAEFLKYMPGVDTDGTNGTAVNVFLRGLPQNYTTVTINGMNLMSADANTGSGSARVFSFESMSLVGIDAIEIEKTVSADVDANAPAGRIDIRTKRAFNRKKGLLTLQLSAASHENMWDGATNTGPKQNGWGNKRFLPNFQASYTNSFFDNRLGIAASIGKSDTYIEREQLTLSRNYAPTAASPDPMGITAIEMSQTARQTSRFSTNLSIDFKATDNLIVSLRGIANRGNVFQATMTPKFTSGVRSRGVQGDALYDFTTQQSATANSYNIARSTQYKVNNSNFISPSFEWRGADVTIDGYGAYSKAKSYYDTPAKGQVVSMTSALNATGNFSASRSEDLLKSDWQIAQLSGPSWADAGSFTLASSGAAPVIRTTNGSTAEVENLSGGFNILWNTRALGMPVELKTGTKFSTTSYKFDDTSGNNLYTYNGPLSNLEFLRAVQGNQGLTYDSLGANISTINGGNALYSPDLAKIYDMFKANPDQWTHTLTPANWLASRVNNQSHYEETTKAAFVMATGELTSRLKLRGGLRWERTSSVSHEFDRLSAEDVVDAGYDVNPTTGIATSIEGMEYQYFTRPKLQRKGSYDYFFPSASLKYEFTRQTQLQFGYSRTILRPEPDVLSGVITRDDVERRISLPNPGLEPALSDNYSARVAHYFEPVGVLSLGVYQNTVKGLFQTYEMTADEYGNTDPNLSDYTFVTTAKVPGEAIKIRGVEFAFNHSLEYLPGPLRFLRVRGSFMYNDPSQPVTRVATKVASATLSYNDRTFRLNLNSVWTGDKYRSTTPTWFEQRWDVSINGAYKLRKNTEIFFSLSNLANQNINVIVPGSLDSTGTLGDQSAINVHNGRNGVVGLRARF